jgi:DNA-directed RNA polymerase III subunit RPC1
MSRLSKLSARFIGEGGFSIGITDVTPSSDLMTNKTAIIKTAYNECDALITDFKAGTLSLLPGCDEDQSLEVRSF